MVVLRVSFNGLLHKTLGERIGVVPWSEPPAESLRIPWKRVKWTVTGVKDVYKKMASRRQFHCSSFNQLMYTNILLEGSEMRSGVYEISLFPIVGQDLSWSTLR